MPSLTRRFASLSAQVADLLRTDIAKGAWGDWMPSERVLTKSLQVSRKTLRKALGQLRRESLVETVHGQGNRILGPAARKAPVPEKQTLVVMLLTPEPLERMRPHTSLWVNHLKSQLIENGARLRPIDGRKFFSQRPAKALAKLVRQHPADCWLLANSREPTQRWFGAAGVPCVIAGSCHHGVDLPDLDLDHYALCRHAAGRLLGGGHRRVAMLNERSGRAGDMESEAGFIAGMRESPHPGVLPQVVNHDQGPEHLSKALARLLEQKPVPTALLVSNPADYLTVVSFLAQRRLRVPQDISVVSRDDDPFLASLVPQPARYSCSPAIYARRMLKPIMQILRGETVVPRHARIFPAYARGGTLIPPQK